MKRVAVLLLFLVNVAQSHAAPRDATIIRAHREYTENKKAVHLERIKADPRYLQTLALCQNHWREYGWIASESAKEILQMGFGYVPAWSRFFANHGLAPDVKDLLDSEAFQQGLLDCGSNQQVIPKMAAADIAGKAVGVVAAAAILRFAGPTLARLGAMGRIGSVAQKSLYLFGFGYVVQQSLVLSDALRDGTLTKAQAKRFVDDKSAVLHDGVGQMKQELSDSYRAELNEIEAKLRSGQLSPEEHQRLEARAERIRIVLH